MALRKGHGNGSGQPRIEVLPVDELPKGIPEEAQPSSGPERAPNGRFLPGNKTSVAGGKRKAGALLLARKLGLSKKHTEEFSPYLKHAEAWRRHKVNELAQTVGGGHCGAGPSSIVATAARQLASSMFLFDLATVSADAELHAKASKLGNDSRQNLLAAHELTAKEAAARPRSASEAAPWLVSKEDSK